MRSVLLVVVAFLGCVRCASSLTRASGAGLCRPALASAARTRRVAPPCAHALTSRPPLPRLCRSANAFAPTAAPAVSVAQARVTSEPIVMRAERKKARAGVTQKSSSFGGGGKGGKRKTGAGDTVGGVIGSAGDVGDFLTGEGLTAGKILIPLWALFVGHSLGVF